VGLGGAGGRGNVAWGKMAGRRAGWWERNGWLEGGLGWDDGDLDLQLSRGLWVGGMRRKPVTARCAGRANARGDRRVFQVHRGCGLCWVWFSWEAGLLCRGGQRFSKERPSSHLPPAHTNEQLPSRPANAARASGDLCTWGAGAMRAHARTHARTHAARTHECSRHARALSLAENRTRARAPSVTAGWPAEAGQPTTVSPN
jgi:hypothetical protein